MKDIVLIPTYTRPEYLYLCLEHLANTERTDSQKVFWVCQDHRENDEHRYGLIFSWVDEVIARFHGALNITKTRVLRHNYSGNSFNVLESYHRAFATDARYVYLVEDDVLVKPDFFRWHEAAQTTEPAAMCSIAYRCSRNHEVQPGVVDPGAYFTTAKDYASIGVCWKRENLAWVLEHDNRDYYGDMDGYMIRRFPGNRFASDFAEQDGLVMRVMWEQRGFTIWPYVPRAYHMGWYGYHRPNGKRPEGFWEQKVGALRAMISDPERLKIAAPDYGDIDPYPVEPVGLWPALCKIQEFV